MKVTLENNPVNEVRPISGFPIAAIGIIVTPGRAGSEHLVGTVFVRGANGDVYFPQSNAWDSDCLKYTGRLLRKGERLIFEGE